MMSTPGNRILDSSNLAIDSGTLCRHQSTPPGPVGILGQNTVTSIRVVNSYDTNERIPHNLEIRPIGSTYVERHHVSAGLANGLQLHPQMTCRAGRYFIKVLPLPPSGQMIGPKPLGETFTREVDFEPQSCQGIEFRVNRKQSILHNIPMTFRVRSNPNADGTEPIYELSAMSSVCKYRQLIENEARRENLDADLVKAIMYMETTHGYYDVAAAIFDSNKSILPMNVRSDYWSELGFTRQQLKQPKYNIRAGIMLLKRLSERVNPSNTESIASTYQNLGTSQVTDYGARVAKIYATKPWIPKPDLFDQLQQSYDDVVQPLRNFENMSPVDQVRFLERLFGGR